MAITIATLRTPRAGLGDLFASGKPDVEAAIKSAGRYFAHVGADVDSSALRSEYNRLAALGYSGRLYPAAGSDLSFERQLELMEAVRPKGADPVDPWAPYWSPGTEANSLTVAELDGAGGPKGFTARLALHSSQPDGYDPLLHFRGLSFDDMYREDGAATQLEAIKRTATQFVAAHPGCSLSAASHRDYPTWVTMDRLDDVPPRSARFVLNTGWMHTPSTGRRSVDRDSFVGSVDSVGGWARFGRSDGRPGPSVGVGLVAG